MPSSSPAKAKEKFPAKSATIKIHNQNPDPSGPVLVSAGGRVHFKNEDDKEYRLSIGRKDSAEKPGFELVLAGHTSVTVAVHLNEELNYTVFDKSGIAENGHGGGPIKSVAEAGAVETGHGGGPVKTVSEPVPVKTGRGGGPVK